MKLDIDFPDLENIVRRMDAQNISWESDAEGKVAPNWAEILIAGIEIPLGDVEVVDGLLAYKGEQVLLYIKDSRKERELLLYEPRRGPRFHVSDCDTLERMRDEGRYERYVVTNNVSGVFKVDARDPFTEQRETVESELKVCKNCLRRLDYQGYLAGTKRRKDIWESFSIEEFFKEFRSVFSLRPKETDVSAVAQGYPPNWKDLSQRFREAAKWRCQKCDVDLSDYPNLLHAHHLNGQTADNKPSNIMVLCIICHGDQPQHRMHIKTSDRRTILDLRRKQGR